MMKKVNSSLPFVSSNTFGELNIYFGRVQIHEAGNVSFDEQHNDLHQQLSI
jgi:hypothetical protein